MWDLFLNYRPRTYRTVPTSANAAAIPNAWLDVAGMRIGRTMLLLMADPSSKGLPAPGRRSWPPSSTFEIGFDASFFLGLIPDEPPNPGGDEHPSWPEAQ